MGIRRAARLLPAVCLLLAAAGVAAAAPDGPYRPYPAPANGTTYALIIGVADYAHLDSLKFSDKDALEFYLYLRRSAPSDAGNIHIFLNKKANRSAIAAAFYKIVNESRPGDRVFIYFSGHGDIEQLYTQDNFFLLLGNCSSRNYMASSENILDKGFFDYYIQPLIAKKVRTIFICDACHSGTLAGGQTGKRNNSEAFARSWKNEIKLLSCLPNQASQEGTGWGGGRGLFSFYLILGIEGLADKDGNGQVSISELQDYLDRTITQASMVFNKMQQPEVTGSGEFIISKPTPAELSEAREQLRENASSGDYKRLASSKGARVQIGNNTFVFKAGSGQNDEHLEMTEADPVTDGYARTLWYEFRSKMEEGRLILPADGSAYHYYQLFVENKKDMAALEEMRTTLLTALLDGYDTLLAHFYQDDTTGFEKGLLAYDRNELVAALALAAGLPAVAGPIKARLLFFDACQVTAAPPGTANSTAPADSAISLLTQAIRTDYSNPALYGKMGDLYFAMQQYSRAAENYQVYTQMLPNEEHAYNRLGLALLAVHDYERAGAAFKKALEIAPSYPAALSNLRVADGLRASAR